MKLAPGVLREARIAPAAITHNIAHLGAIVGVPIIAVVKADGYGHGSVRSARAALAGGARMLGVTDLSEAFVLREAGISAPIISWLHAPGTDFREAVAQDIVLGVSSLAQVEAAAAAGSAARPARVHCKVETGLGRNGIAPEELPAVLARIAELQDAGVLRVEGVFSHLSNTSDADDREAAARFLAAIDAFRAAGIDPGMRHLAATAAAIDLPELRFDAVRIGIGAYGLSPFADRTSADLGLRPAMTLVGQVAAVRDVAAGAGASYGYTYRAEQPTRFALVPLGYCDGIPRAASNRAPVRIGERTMSIAGRVAMDQFIVDVGATPVEVGDCVELFGDPLTGCPSADDWALAADTINYEIVTRIGSRVPRREV